MPKTEISPGIYWVGAIDWNLRFCGSYTTPRGTTYNSYLVVGDKVALVDTVKDGFAHESLSRINEIISPDKIDYVICQHAEMDHSGAMPEIMREAKNAKVISTRAAQEALLAHFGTDWGAGAVNTGDALSLGKKTLSFIEAKMLHWPDNMFTFVKEPGLLFSNDAFGQHAATFERFEDTAGSFIMEEAAKYYAVIVSVYAAMVKAKIKEISGMGLDIRMIAPAHGVTWRAPGKIISAYERWSSGANRRKAVVVFDTMWHSTEKMAGEIARGLSSEGVDTSVFNLRNSDLGMIMKDVIDARLILVGSPTLNMGVFPTVAGFLAFLKGTRPLNKMAGAFGSYGWGNAAVGLINEEFAKMKFEVLPGLEFKYVPGAEQLRQAFEHGLGLARRM